MAGLLATVLTAGPLIVGGASLNASPTQLPFSLAAANAGAAITTINAAITNATDNTKSKRLI
jgi:hypothetical protein